MSYELNALIASVDLLNVVAAEVPVARVAPLEQGLALIPITEEVYRALHQPGGPTELGFALAPDGFGRRLTAWSQADPIGYVEADYFGGVGIQRAAVWESGRIVLGPLQLAAGIRPTPDGSPISQALRRLGARSDGPSDEFAAVGLGRYRHSADWSGKRPA